MTSEVLGGQMNGAVDRVVGSGEMSELVRAQDWSATPLGPIEHWSEPLLTTVNLVLCSHFPMCLYWGAEWTMVYNDAYRAFLTDRHPQSLGKPVLQVWKELAELVRPEFESVFRDGKAKFQENVLIPTVRDGVLQDCFWTFSRSPVFENGEIMGALNVCLDTTETVKQTRKLRDGDEQKAVLLKLIQGQRETSDPDAIMRAAAVAVGDYMLADRVGFFEVANEQTLSLPACWTNGRLEMLDEPFEVEDLGAGFVEEMRAGKTRGVGDVATDPLTASSVFEEIGVRSIIGSPIVRNGHWYAGMYVNCTEVREWTHEEVDFVCEVAEQTWDAVDRARAQQALSLSEERLRMALAASKGVGAWDWDVPNDLVYSDKNFAQVYGVEPERAAKGVPLVEFAKSIHADDSERVGVSIADALRTGEDFAEEYRLMRADGSVRWVAAEGRCLLDEHGAPLRFTGVTLDITERKLTEAALRQSEKLAAVGRLASSIAHEINNPLESVTNLLYLARTSEEIPVIQEFLDIAERELRRASAITNQTLRFHKQSTSPKPVTCSDLIGSALSLHQGRLINSGIDVDKRKRAGCPIKCFDGEIRQVLSNLIGNAIDAMHSGGGGRLYLRSREGTAWKTGRKGLVITIADTGMGMSAETVKHVFEPFFTTKGIGGNGLGLWISQEIVARHEGLMAVRSSQREGSRGTVFTLFLPFDAATRP